MKDYLTVASFGNDTNGEIRLFLEMTCEEVVIAPGQTVELLAKPLPGLLPLSIHQVSNGIQIFPNKEFDVDWHLRFNGITIKAGNPTILSDIIQSSI